MTDSMKPDGLTAVLLQLADITARLATLDERQAGDARHLTDRVTALAAIVSDLKGTAASHGEALTALLELDRRLAEAGAGKPGPDGDDDGRAASYQPPAAPRFWKPDGPDRDQAVSKLRAWIDQVYRPGYGHLAASLGDCWEQHPLCLYILDWLSELWSVLYLQPSRTAGTLAGQAEWHVRLLAAAADLLARETRGCAHRAGWQQQARTGSRP